MSRKLQEYALVAEIISAIAVITSLIFIGIEVRNGTEATIQNTRALTRDVEYARAETRAGQFVESAYLPAIQAKMSDSDIASVPPLVNEFGTMYSLTEEESIRWWRLLFQNWLQFQAEWNYELKSTESCAIAARYLRFADHAIFWAEFKTNPAFNTEFVQCVDSIP